MATQEKPQISKFGQTFISYGSYHYDNTNKIIHIICIPIITITLFALLSYIPYRFDVQGYSIGWEHIFSALALLFYMTIHPLITIAMAAILYLSSLGWKAIFAGYSQEEMFKIILVLQIFAWVLQFVGHGVFQKRKPALMDNLLQIFSAPLFVLIQLLDLIGIRTNDVEIWKKEIKKNVMEFRKSKSA